MMPKTRCEHPANERRRRNEIGLGTCPKEATHRGFRSYREGRPDSSILLCTMHAAGWKKWHSISRNAQWWTNVHVKRIK